MADDTSQRNPIRVDFVNPDALQAPGRLGLTFAPGKKWRGSLYGVVYDRDLHADLMRLKGSYQAKVLVSLMEPFEYELLGIEDLFEQAEGSASRCWPSPSAMSVRLRLSSIRSFLS